MFFLLLFSDLFLCKTIFISKLMMDTQDKIILLSKIFNKDAYFYMRIGEFLAAFSGKYNETKNDYSLLAFICYNLGIERFIIVLSLHNFVKLYNISTAREKDIIINNYAYILACINITAKYYKDDWHSQITFLNYFRSMTTVNFSIKFFNDIELCVCQRLDFKFRVELEEIEILVRNIFNICFDDSVAFVKYYLNTQFIL
jgi:hypothetical protein